MRWNIILPLSLPIGLAMGMASVMGWTGVIASTGVRLELILWIFIAVLCAMIIATRVSRKRFLHGLLIGILLSMCNSVCQSVFNTMYYENNPDLAEKFQQPDTTIPIVVVPLITGPIIGIIYGTFIGGFAWYCGLLREHHPRRGLRRLVRRTKE